MTFMYRGYKIFLRPTRCAYMTIWTYTIKDEKKTILDGDGGFSAEDSLRCAKLKIDMM